MNLSKDIKPLVSVVIPFKNRIVELQRALLSVLNQSYQNFEILIIDDYSAEKPMSIIEEINDPRIIYVKNDKEISNANVCRNIGIENSKGEFIAMLDSDDEWLSHHLESKLNFLIDNKADGVFGSYKIFNGTDYRNIISRPFKSSEKMVDYILTDGKAQTSSYFIKSSVAKKVTWDESLLRHQDYDYSIRLRDKFNFIPNQDISVIVHWDTEKRPHENIEAQKLFIDKYEKQMKGSTFNLYHENIYQTIKKREDLNLHIIEHYNRNRTKYIHDISYNHFMGCQKSNPNKFERVFFRLKYLFRVLTYK